MYEITRVWTIPKSAMIQMTFVKFACILARHEISFADAKLILLAVDEALDAKMPISKFSANDYAVLAALGSIPTMPQFDIPPFYFTSDQFVQFAKIVADCSGIFDYAAFLGFVLSVYCPPMPYNASLCKPGVEIKLVERKKRR